MFQTHGQLESDAPSDLRLFLQSELIRRCKINPKYSIRAFARTLKLEPSELSKILNGKRGISHTKFHRIERALHLSPSQRSAFLIGLKEQREKQKKKKTENPVTHSYTQL